MPRWMRCYSIEFLKSAIVSHEGIMKLKSLDKTYLARSRRYIDDMKEELRARGVPIEEITHPVDIADLIWNHRDINNG